MELWKQRPETQAASTADSSLVFIVKSLLFPIIPVLTLLICLAVSQQSFRGPYFLVAVLGFLGASDFLGAVQICGSSSQQPTRYVLLDITARWIVLVGFVGTLLYLSDLTGHFDYRVLAAWTLVTPLALWCGQRGANYWLIQSGIYQGSPRRAIIVGINELGMRLARSLHEDALLRTDIVGYFDDRSPERLQLTPGSAMPVLGPTSGLAEYVAKNDVNVVFITLPISRDQRIVSMLEALHDSTASIYFVPDLFVLNLLQARFDVMNGIPVVAVWETPFYGALWLVKRLSDILIASSALLVTLPLFVLIAIGIRLDSPGPILFKQKRYGLDGRKILVYKFRSMSVTEDGQSSYTQVARNDSRVTAFGALLRRTSLDELPQLLNVLEGTMSVVGPRPHAIAVNERYRQLIPCYMSRHKVKPGITGWAQVNGYRGGDDLESMTKRIEFDLDYLRYWSLWLDLVILLKTVTLVWKDKSAY